MRTRKVLAAMPTFDMLHVSNARQGFVEPADFEAVAAYLEPALQDLARFSYATGWRKGEVVGLGWANVDLVGGTVRLWDRETKKREAPDGRPLRGPPGNP